MGLAHQHDGSWGCIDFVERNRREGEMWSVHGRARRLCDGSSRRDFLRVGAIAGLGLDLPGLMRSAGAAPPAGTPAFGRARRCILLFPFGGPPQLDTFDPKPDAPTGVRGELRPIA